MAPLSGPSTQHLQFTYTYSHFYNRARGLILGNTDILNPVNRRHHSTTNLNKNISNQREQSKHLIHIHIQISNKVTMELQHHIGIIVIMIAIHLYKDYKDNKGNL